MERHPDFGELKITNIEKTSLSNFKSYEMQWPVINYSQTKPNKWYIMHTIFIQSHACRFTLKKKQGDGQSHPNLILSLLHAPNFSSVWFKIIGKNNRQIEASQNRYLLIPRRERQARFETPDLIGEETFTISVKIILSTRGNQLSIFESVDKPNLGNLLESGMFADLEIVVGEKTFLAHKAILSAQSTSLTAMFDTMNTEKRLRIDFANAEAVQEMLNYIYTGETELLNSELALNLFQLADKYDLQGLRFKAVSFLKKGMSLSHAMRILVMADSHNLEDLKDYATQHIGKRLALAMLHEDWASFRKRKDLLDIVLQYAAEYHVQQCSEYFR